MAEEPGNRVTGAPGLTMPPRFPLSSGEGRKVLGLCPLWARVSGGAATTQQLGKFFWT